MMRAKILGKVASGLGRAQVFMSQPHYQKQFRDVLGATAWPGTLNIEVRGEDLETYAGLRAMAGLCDGDTIEDVEPHRINGFEREGRSFGGATAFPASISKDGSSWHGCAVLIPDLTRHTETAEIIASSFLRELLPAVDGDFVSLIIK